MAAFSDPEAKFAPSCRSRAIIRGFSGVSVLRVQNFGFARRPQSPGLQRRHRPAGDRGQRRRAAAGPGPLIKAGELILGYPGEAGVPLPMPEPEVLGRNGTYVGFQKYESRVGAFNRFLRAHGSTEDERELLAAKLVGRWRSGAPLTLAPEVDDTALGADPRRNNDFDYANDKRGQKAPLNAISGG